MSDVTPFDRKEIIEENRKEIEERLSKDPNSLEAFCVMDDLLDEVFRIVNSVKKDLPHKKKVITMAAYFMGAMSWAQPFCGANKRTAIFMAIVFMRDNGYDLEIPGYDEGKLMDLLYEVQLDRSSPDASVMYSLILYTEERTLSYG